MGRATGNAGSLKTLAIHWDGEVGASSRLRCSILRYNQVLVGIVALSSNNISTAESAFLPSTGSAQHTLTENWAGLNWNFVSSPNAEDLNNRLRDIIGDTGRTARLGGRYNRHLARPERTLILRKNP